MVTASVGNEVAQATLSVTAVSAMRVPGKQFVSLGTELRFRVSSLDPAATLSAGELPVGASFDGNSGEFRWTPAGTQMGSHAVSFTATDAVGGKSNASVAIDVESGEPVVTRIVNAASHSADAACSAGAMATIEGRWLADGAGTKVWANGVATPILRPRRPL